MLGASGIAPENIYLGWIFLARGLADGHIWDREGFFSLHLLGVGGFFAIIPCPAGTCFAVLANEDRKLSTDEGSLIGSGRVD